VLVQTSLRQRRARAADANPTLHLPAVNARLPAFVSRSFEASPLQNAPFRNFYFGSIGAALGYTMQATIAAWLMATLTTSALMVALVQSASTAPTLLFGLAAGTLADIVSRRRVILVTQVVLFAASLLLGLAALTGIIGPLSLLFLTFLVGAGFTFYLPAQQASINEMVPREALARAVALGSVAFNVARAVGPALAGAIAAALSSGSALAVGAFFFVPMFVAMYRTTQRETALPGVPERLLSGIMSGLRFVRHSAPMRALIVRNLAFSVCASAFWALLPVIARDQLGLGAGGFGLLSASFGIGAIVGAMSIPGQLHRSSMNQVVTSGGHLWALALLIVALTAATPLALLGAGCAGMGACACGVDESRRDTGLPRARQRRVGRARLRSGHALGARRVGGRGGRVAVDLSARTRTDGRGSRHRAECAGTRARDGERAAA